MTDRALLDMAVRRHARMIMHARRARNAGSAFGLNVLPSEAESIRAEYRRIQAEQAKSRLAAKAVAVVPIVAPAGVSILPAPARLDDHPAPAAASLRERGGMVVPFSSKREAKGCWLRRQLLSLGGAHD